MVLTSAHIYIYNCTDYLKATRYIQTRSIGCQTGDDSSLGAGEDFTDSRTLTETTNNENSRFKGTDFASLR